jgi:DNA-directed RNA polymerase subunit RPC12/RpoP
MVTTFAPGHPAVAALRCPRCSGMLEKAQSFNGRICMRCGRVAMDPDAARIIEQTARASARAMKTQAAPATSA